MRDLVRFAAHGVNLAWHEGHGVIEFANGFDNHRKTIVLA